MSTTGGGGSDKALLIELIIVLALVIFGLWSLRSSTPAVEESGNSPQSIESSQ